MVQAGSLRAEAVREAAGIVISLTLVVALAALALRALDALPQVLTGERQGVVRLASIEGAERALQTPLLLPTFFPDSLRWPPAAIKFYAGPPPTVALTFASRTDASERLALYESRGARASVPMALMPAGLVLYRVGVPMADGDAVLYRVQMGDGSIRNDLVWHRVDSTVALRYGGAADELVIIAHSLRRRRP
jgi:hypothetical protein